jgi:hypothetical protein
VCLRACVRWASVVVIAVLSEWLVRIGPLILALDVSEQARFSSLPPKTTMQSHLKNLKLPAKVSNTRLRVMTTEDVPAMHRLLNDHLNSTYVPL